MFVRTTVQLEKEIYEKLRQVASPRKMSRFINRALEEVFKQREKQRLGQLMKEGYIATNKNRKSLNEDWQVVDTEGWPK